MLYMMVLIVFIMPLNTLAQNGRIVGTLFDPIRDIGIAYAGVKYYEQIVLSLVVLCHFQ